MMGEREFIYTGHPARVIFGFGTTARLPEELARLGKQRALVLATPAQKAEAESLLALLGPAGAGIFAGAAMHTPVDVSELATKQADALSADVLVAVGGGSTIGLSKAIALRTDLPQLVLPTTYAGSEMTPIIGQTENGVKRTRTTLKVLPEVVIYDVEQTLGLPVGMSGTSGMNAMAHAIEALYARETNPIISALAIEAIRSLARALPIIAKVPGDRDARADALYGAWLCGICLGSVGMALHHKLCHTLGGSFDLPHAETHTIMLPHALAYNAPAIPDVMKKLTDVLGTDPSGALFDLARAIRAPAALSQIGMPEDGIGKAVESAFANPYWNPRPLEKEAITTLITRAHSGERPVID